MRRLEYTIARLHESRLDQRFESTLTALYSLALVRRPECAIPALRELTLDYGFESTLATLHMLSNYCKFAQARSFESTPATRRQFVIDHMTEHAYDK